MIATLTGKFLLRYTDRVIVEVGGIGYEVFLSTDSISRLGEPGEDVFLFVYTHVREDAILLYGFIEEEEKEMFLILKTVNGVGPKLALGILSGMKVTELCRAIAVKDFKLLTSLSGVGKKMAERLCLDLKDKVTHIAGASLESSEGEGPGATTGGSVLGDVLSALVNLGYPDPIARQALVSLKKRVGQEKFSQMSLEEMLKEGLRILA